ncbi:MAG: hypothetical protein IH590_00315 [Aquamicrobium sp.]|nr:hypothetical protein [Aquamicrobium sp.]
MIDFPDLRPLFFLAIFGLICAVIIVIAGGGWLGYHLFMAMSLYLGGA